MSGSVALATAGLGLWAVLAPVLLGWRYGSHTLAGAVLPGLLVAAAGAYTGFALVPAPEGEERDRLLVSLTSSTLLLGVWMLLCPFILGIAMATATYLVLLLPGAGITGLSLLNGYLGWREPDW